MKVFYVSWNDLETVFHEMPWKKNFTVYPSLKSLLKIVKSKPRTDDQIFDIWKLNVAIKKKFPKKLLAAVNLIQMMYR